MANPFKVGDKVRRKEEHLGATFIKNKVYIVEEVSPSGIAIVANHLGIKGDISW